MLAAALVLVPAAQAYALEYARNLMATTIPEGGTKLLIDGQFTELYFWNPVPNYASTVVNSTYVSDDYGYFLEVGRAYNYPGIQKNPVGFIAWYTDPRVGYKLGFMDGSTI